MSGYSLIFYLVYDNTLSCVQVDLDDESPTRPGNVEMRRKKNCYRMESRGHSQGSSTSLSICKSQRRAAMTWLASSAEAGILVHEHGKDCKFQFDFASLPLQQAEILCVNWIRQTTDHIKYDFLMLFHLPLF